jgi:hypothetical protein
MKNLIYFFMILSLLVFPVMATNATNNEHDVAIFDDWIYNDYNNEGDWVTFDLASIAPSLNNKRVFARISLEVTDYTNDQTEYVKLEVREYDGGYKELDSIQTRHQDSEKVQINVWTDDDAHIQYKITYGWTSWKQVRVVINLENSID